LIDVLELGPAFAAGEVFVRQGRPGFGKESWEIAAAEVCGEGLAQEVEGGGEVRAGGCFVMAERTNNNGVGRKVELAE